MEGEKNREKKVSVKGRASSYSFIAQLSHSKFKSSRSELRQAQDNVSQQSRNEDERKDSWSVLVVIPPLGAPRPHPQLSVNENDGRVRDGEQSGQRKHRSGN